MSKPEVKKLSPAAVEEIQAIIGTINTRAELQAVDAEAVDTGADIVQLAQIMEVQFGDGFQWPDLFGLIPAQPIVNELIRDFLIAVGAVAKTAPDLTVELALMIYEEAKRRGPLGAVSRQICRFFYWAATSYDTGDQILDLVNTQKDRSVALWNNLPLLPDEFPVEG